MAKALPKEFADRAFEGQGLVFVYKNNVYYIGIESLARYIVPQSIRKKKDILRIVENYLEEAADKSKIIKAVIIPMLHIMEGGG